MNKELLNAGPSTHGWHGLGLALRCPRLYAWNKQHPKTNLSRPPLIKGSLVHQGLAHFYRRLQAKQVGDNPDKWYEPLESIVLLAAEETKKVGDASWMEWVEFAQEAVRQYEEYWGEENFKIIAVEKELWANVHDEKHGLTYPYTQRADLIIESVNGEIFIVDHKTTARMTSSTAQRYSLSGQMVGYNVLGKGLFGKKFAGVLLNMLELGKGFPDSLAKFERVTAESTPFSWDKFRKTIIHANRIINDYKDLPVEEWPGSHLTTGCFTNFGACDYQSECQWGF